MARVSATVEPMSDELMEDKKEYELSFILPTEEAGADVERAVVAAGGEITTKSPLQNMRLAYPVKKHASAIFGFYYFSASPEVAAKLNEALRTNKNVLRHLIVTPPIKLAPREQRFMREGKRIQGPLPRAAKTEEPRPAPTQVLSNEGLEKELQQILQ